MPVYFVRAGEDGPVKIGWSECPSSRIHDLQGGHHEALILIREIETEDFGLERRLHERFRHKRLRGEWFVFDSEMLLIQPDDLPPPPIPKVWWKGPSKSARTSEIGTVLAEARKAAGFQQNQLAELLGISNSYLCDLEQNRRSLPMARIEDLPPDIRKKVASAMLVSRWHDIEKLRRWADAPAPRGT